MSLATDRIVRNHLEQEDYLTSRISSIEAQTIDWITKVNALHASVDPADQSQILAHKTDLTNKLNAALAL